MEQVSQPESIAPVRTTDIALCPSPGTQPAAAKASLVEQSLFLAFVLMAFVLFAAPTILPELKRYSQLRVEERALATEVQRLEMRSDHLVEYAAAMSDSPETNEMLARQELNYKRAGEKVVVIPPAASTWGNDFSEQPTAAKIPLVPPDWPELAHRAEAWTASRGLLDPLVDPSLRLTWMLMSGGLLIAAFVLFRARRHPSL